MSVQHGPLDPLAGYPAARSESVAMNVAPLRDRIYLAHVAARAAVGRVDGAFEGAVDEAWLARANALLAKLAGLEERIQGSSYALNTAPGEYQYLRYPVEAALDERERALHTASRAGDLAFDQVTGARGFDTSGTSALIWQAEQDILSAANRERFAAEQTLAQLEYNRHEIDKALIRAFNGLSEGSVWRSAAGSFKAAGGNARDIGWSEFRDMRRELHADALDAAARITAGAGTADDLAKLDKFLSRFGAEQEAMSAFFRDLGGVGAANLFGALLSDPAWQSSDPDSGLPARLKQGLSAGSRGWSPDVAASFAGGFFGAVIDQRQAGTVLALGFVFSGAENHPMGEHFTVAMANVIDRHERVNGEWPLIDSSGDTRLHDASGRVLQTLGQYPEPALNWLTPERIKYWYGRRDCSPADGFEGPSALWAGIQNVPGGPLDGWTDFDTLRDLAIGNSYIGRALHTNPHFFPENLTNVGVYKLSSVLSPMLVQFVNYPILDAMYPPAGSYQMTSFLGLGDPLPMTLVSKDELQSHLAAVTFHPEGHQLMLQGALDIRDIFLNIGGDDAVITVGSNEMIKGGVFGVFGAIEGSRDYALVSHGARADDAAAARRAMPFDVIDAVSDGATALASIPWVHIPAKISGPLDVAALGSSLLRDSVVNAARVHEAEAIAGLLSDQPEDSAAARDFVSDIWSQLYDAERILAPNESYTETFQNGWYGAFSGNRRDFGSRDPSSMNADRW